MHEPRPERAADHGARGQYAAPRPGSPRLAHAQSSALSASLIKEPFLRNMSAIGGGRLGYALRLPRRWRLPDLDARVTSPASGHDRSVPQWDASCAHGTQGTDPQPGLARQRVPPLLGCRTSTSSQRLLGREWCFLFRPLV